MKEKHKTSSWKEKHIQHWEKIASIYFAIKDSPSAKLILKFIILILRMILSIIVRRIFLYFFPNF